MISNYNIYLELIKREDSFTEEALVSYGNGLEKYFTLLITEYPDQNYKGTINKLNAIKKNFSNTEILKAIDKIDFLIESNNPNAF